MSYKLRFHRCNNNLYHHHVILAVLSLVYIFNCHHTFISSLISTESNHANQHQSSSSSCSFTVVVAFMIIPSTSHNHNRNSRKKLIGSNRQLEQKHTQRYHHHFSNNVVHNRRQVTRRMIRQDTIIKRRMSQSLNNDSDDTKSIRNMISEERREELLQRNGPFFQLNKLNGQVEFGSTAELTTQLNDIGGIESWNMVANWLKDSDSIAMSIWDPKNIIRLDNSIYRLLVMKLQFIIFSVQPTVDMKMKTEYYNNDINKPIFIIQSIQFNPNVQLLPGTLPMNIDSLGITIEVVGRLVPSKNGKGVTGCISFATCGILPKILQILPNNILRIATDTINETIVQFAIKSFESGAIDKYQQFINNQMSIQQQQKMS